MVIMRFSDGLGVIGKTHGLPNNDLSVLNPCVPIGLHPSFPPLFSAMSGFRLKQHIFLSMFIMDIMYN